MEQHNFWLTTELTRQRYEEIRREAEHRSLLAEHGLDLWSLLRRAIRRRPPKRSAAPIAAFPAPAAHAEDDARAGVAA